MIAYQKKPCTAGAVSRVAGSFWAQKLRSPLVLSLLLAVVTLAVYWPVRHHDFVNYDDSEYVSANPHVQSGLRWANAAWAFSTGFASNWHPLTWCSHMLDWQLFGNSPGAFHLVNLGFHIANTVLLLLLLQRMTGALWRSTFVAALFALHPLHVESVAWISERKDVLSTLFFLLTLWAYGEYARRSGAESPRAEIRRPKEARRPQPETVQPKSDSQTSGKHASRITHHASRPPGPLPYYCLALTLFALGLMSKPMLVTLPFVLLLLDYWPLRRLEFRSENAECRSQSRPSPKAECSNFIIHHSSFFILFEKLPFFALCVGSSIITFIVQRRGGAVSTAVPLEGRVANALVSYGRYLGKMLWPDQLSVLYPHPGHWPWGRVLGSATLLLLITGTVVLCARRRAYLAMGWFWFLGTLVPVIGLVQVGVQSMADRYSYVPLIGLFIILAWGLSEALSACSWRTPARSVLASLALVACIGLTRRQLQYWRDSQALFAHAVEVTQDNYLAYNNLGFYLANHGQAEEAMENYRKSLAINPNYEDALNNLGYSLAGQRQYQQAIPLYEHALRVRPRHPEVHNNLGNALSELGQVDEAIAHYLVALKENPEHADAHNNYGIALAMKGRLDEAVREFHDAIRFKPSYASAHSNLGNALAALHQFDEAALEFKASLHLNPDDAQAHNNLANVLAEQGRFEEAVAHYQKALALNADNPEAHFNLAQALLRQQKPTEALPHLTEALRLKPDYAAARQQLEALRPNR